MQIIENLKKGLGFRDRWDKSKQLPNADEEFTPNLHIAESSGSQSVYEAMGMGGIVESTDELASDYVDTSMKAKASPQREATAIVKPGRDVPDHLKTDNPADTSFSYIEELRKLAKKHGQEFKQDQTAGGRFTFERNGETEISIDQKYGMQYFGKNPEGAMFQDYIKLTAKKYLENNKMIDVWVNEKAIPDFAQRQAYFQNVTDNLVEMGIDPNRIRFKNAGFEDILEAAVKKHADAKFAPSHTLSESGEVLTTDRTPEQRQTDIAIQSSFHMLSTSYLTSNKAKNPTAADAILKNLGLSVAFDKKGENITFKKLAAEPNGEFHTVTFKSSDVANASRFFEIYNKPAEQKMKVEKPESAAKPKSEQKSENKTDNTNQPASKKTDSIVLTNNITAIVNKSGGNIVNFEKDCEKAGIKVSFTDDNKSIKVWTGADSKDSVKISLNNDSGKLLTKAQNTQDEFARSDALRALADAKKDEPKSTSSSKNKRS